MDDNKPSTITIDNVEYVRADAVKAPSTADRAYIVCGGGNGSAVIFGFAPEGKAPVPGKPYTLHDARMVLRWDAACKGLFGLVAGGPKADTRLSGKLTIPFEDEKAHQVFPVADSVARLFVDWTK